MVFPLGAFCYDQSSRDELTCLLPACLPLFTAFATPLYRNLLILTIGGVALYRFSLLHAQPHPSRASSSGRSAPGNESEDDHNEEIQGDDRPFLTRYIEGWMTPASFWQERTAHHVDVHKDQAELKLFLQDAERPPIHRMRFPQSMGMGSPHCRPVGGQVDMKDLNVRSGSEY